MAYTYCRKCDQGQDAPTVRQLLTDWTCWNCSEKLVAPGTEVNDAIVHLLDRIETIEEKLGIVPEQFL